MCNPEMYSSDVLHWACNWFSGLRASLLFKITRAEETAFHSAEQGVGHKAVDPESLHDHFLPHHCDEGQNQLACPRSSLRWSSGRTE
jgi:hypothetical protein